jgi:hypothetical protein
MLRGNMQPTYQNDIPDQDLLQGRSSIRESLPRKPDRYNASDTDGYHGPLPFLPAVKGLLGRCLDFAFAKAAHGVRCDKAGDRYLFK